METFIFYKHNRIDQKFEMTKKELSEKFKTFLETADNEWLDYYQHSVIHFFVAGTKWGGLYSPAEDLEKVIKFLEPYQHAYFRLYIYEF